MTARMKRSRRLSLEALEGRKLMAGDVSVQLEGELLKVYGDNLGNQVVVSQAVSGDVTISGQNGTRINGVSSVRLVNPQLNALDIRLEGGDDRLTLSGVRVANDLTVNLGAGNDAITSPATAPVVVGANAIIDGAEGADSINLAGLQVAEDLKIDGGIGALNVRLSASAVDKSLTVTGDDANDFVSLSGIRVGEGLSIETKGGADTVSLLDVLAFSLSMNSDAGADRVTLNRVTTQEDIGIFTGDGNDIVSLTDVRGGKSLTVSTDAGNDTVSGTRVRVAEDAVFEGGAGIDIFTDLGITAGIKKDIKEFEVRR